MYKKTKLNLILSFLLLFFFSTSLAYAADLSVLPAQKSVTVSDIFTVNVVVSPNSENVNAYSGTISFPTDKVEVLNINTTGSVVDFWAQEPSFSSITGKVNFEGVTINGFNGQQGHLLSISFKAKKVGLAKLDLINGSVLANDGNGTEVLQNKNDSDITIVDSVKADAPVTPTLETPTADTTDSSNSGFTINIRSNTHPDEDKWYSVNSAEFSWDLNKDVTAVRTILSESKSSTPSIVYDPPIKKKVIDDIQEGTLYFHIQAKVDGKWGEDSIYKIKTDNSVPSSLDIEKQNNSGQILPYKEFILNAYDDISGIEKYVVYINNQKIEEVGFEENLKYRTPDLLPNDYEIKFVAVDYAGNEISKNLEFQITTVAKPEITKVDIDKYSGENLVVEGKAETEKVLIVVEDANSENKALVLDLVDSGDIRNFVVDVVDGKFTFNADEKIEDGKYYVSAYGMNSEGALSYRTNKVLIEVGGSSLKSILNGLNINNIISYTLYAVLILIIFIVLLFLYLIARYRIELYRKLMKRRKEKPDHLLHDEFELLQSNVESHLAVLDRIQRGLKLNNRELRALARVMNNLKRVEMTLQSNLDDIGVDTSSKDSKKLEVNKRKKRTTKKKDK